MSNMVNARDELNNLQRFLGEWSVDLNQFLGHISKQNQKLNRNWNDPRQAQYQKSWVLFEQQQKDNHKIAQAISEDLSELSAIMAEYLEEMVFNEQAFERLNQVQGLTGWPASARQPVDVTELVPDIKEYKSILDNFRQGLKEHTHKIMNTIQHLRNCIYATRVNEVCDNVEINIQSWIAETEKSTGMLSGSIDEIHKVLSRLI